MAQATIRETNFTFPQQTALYHGKVRDTYTIADRLLVAVATDRISAFDVILPETIPCKGQVLNQLAAHFLDRTADIVPNWLLDTPDPNVSIGNKAVPFEIELVIRGSLVGHAWRAYKDGERMLCGVRLPEGMKEFQRFPSPIITPSTKAAAGHDEDISVKEIIKRGLCTKEEWGQIADYTHALFTRGQEMVANQGLILADTKYEFGKLGDTIVLIDEVHTPDSSRYFYADSYEAYINGDTTEHPRHLSKEFVREWLLERDFSGQDGQKIPDMTPEFVQSISERYIELYERLTGKQFVPDTNADPAARIQKNVIKALKNL